MMRTVHDTTFITWLFQAPRYLGIKPVMSPPLWSQSRSPGGKLAPKCNSSSSNSSSLLWQHKAEKRERTNLLPLDSCLWRCCPASGHMLIPSFFCADYFIGALEGFAESGLVGGRGQSATGSVGRLQLWPGWALWGKWGITNLPTTPHTKKL